MAKYVRAEITLAERVLFTPKEIQQGILKLSDQVVGHYGSPEDVMAVCLLKGGVPLAIALLANLKARYNWDLPIEYMRASSAPKGAHERTPPQMSGFHHIPPHKHLLVIDDIVDTRRTLRDVYALLINRGARTVTGVGLVNKYECQEVDFPGVLFWALSVPGKPWVFGFGIDQDGEIGRNEYCIMVGE